MSEHLPLIESGVLTIGIDASAPPPFHSDFASSEFEGFEVDLTKAVAARLGLSVKYKSALWSNIMSDLQEGKLDMICTAATITEDRKRIVSFSKPYFDIQLAIVSGSVSSIQKLEDLKDKVIGVRTTTIAEDFARKHAKAKLIRTFHMNTESYKALQEGQLDAVIDDFPIAKSFTKLISGLKLAATIPGTEAQYGMMFAKRNDELRQAVNRALTEIKADGTYAESYKKWFGENAPMTISG